jgi:hypothetical protein
MAKSQVAWNIARREGFENVARSIQHNAHPEIAWHKWWTNLDPQQRQMLAGSKENLKELGTFFELVKELGTSAKIKQVQNPALQSFEKSALATAAVAAAGGGVGAYFGGPKTGLETAGVVGLLSIIGPWAASRAMLSDGGTRLLVNGARSFLHKWPSASKALVFFARVGNLAKKTSESLSGARAGIEEVPEVPPIEIPEGEIP